MSLRSWLPARLRAGLRRLYYYPEWYLSPAGWWSNARLAKLKNLHAGQRCFVLGNGPSLQQTDLSRLTGDVVFGMNRIYLAYEELGFHADYLVSVNPLVLQQVGHEIAAAPGFKFIGWAGRRYVPFTSDMAYIRTRAVAEFQKDPTWDLWEGATVTTVALQLAYYMGFSEVILVGVDHHFRTDGVPHAEVVSDGPDEDHFRPDYFGKGFRWQLPDLETSAMSYEAARLAFAQDGRRIVDATIGGRLQVFEKVDYDSLF